MQHIYEFLNAAGIYYLATSEGGQPHLRPFGTVHIFDGKLCFQTGRAKAVSRQLHANPKLEICAMSGHDWLRLEATAVEDDRREARVSMLEAYPGLKTLYSPDDGNCEVWYLRNASATIFRANGETETHRF